MIVVPAIDIRGGKVVRLRQGRPEDETAYANDPVEAARRWEAEGAERLHLVDLDAAIDGRPQPDAVGAVVAAVGIPVEVGGGLRTIAAARRYRDVGVERLIFGTAAVTRPEMVEEAARLWPGAVAVAVDVAKELHLDVPRTLCPKLLSYPVWPEVIGGTSQVTDSVAWRVDFIEKRYFLGYKDSVAWSIARVYVHVVSGDTLGVIFGQPIPYPNP